MKHNDYFRKVNGKEIGEKEFSVSQYEGFSSGIFLFKEQVPARYIEQEVPEYKNNLLIEALPPLFTTSEITDLLEQNPLFSSPEKLMSEEYRFQAISRLERYLTIFPQHIEIERKLALAIRKGYINKRINTPDFLERVKFTSELIRNKDIPDKMSELRCIPSVKDTSISGLSVIGISGGGKSTAIKNILSLYPQCIIHTQYAGSKFLFKQVPWLLVDCSHNGSLKGLCKKILTELDNILGSAYLSKHGKDSNSVEDMIVSISHLAQIHGIGMIVIDEIQHLVNKKYTDDRVMNFLVTLQNEVGIPVVLVGTYKAASELLGKDFRLARRASGLGEVFFDNMRKDEQWDAFIESMWQFQWIKEQVPLTNEMKNLMYDKTAGITERVIKLFMAAQMEAIITGREKFAYDNIKTIADEHMLLAKDMCKALNERDIEKLSKFDDIRPVDIDEYIENQKAAMAERNRIAEELKREKKLIDYNRKNMKDELVLSLMGIGIDDQDSKRIADTIIKKYGTDKGISFLKSKIKDEVFGQVPSKKASSNPANRTSDRSPKKKERKPIEDDISGYESYKSQGIIKSNFD